MSTVLSVILFHNSASPAKIGLNVVNHSRLQDISLWNAWRLFFGEMLPTWHFPLNSQWEKDENNTVICLLCLHLTNRTYTYGQCFAESPFGTQINLRNHLARRSRPLLWYTTKVLIYLKTTSQPHREQTSELRACPNTVTDPSYGKAPWQGQPDLVWGADRLSRECGQRWDSKQISKQGQKPSPSNDHNEFCWEKCCSVSKKKKLSVSFCSPNCPHHVKSVIWLWTWRAPFQGKTACHSWQSSSLRIPNC